MTLEDFLYLVDTTHERTGVRPYLVKLPPREFDELAAEAKVLELLEVHAAEYRMKVHGMEVRIADDMFTLRRLGDMITLRVFTSLTTTGVDIGLFKEEQCS